jgi:hypothetical protein
MLVCDAAVIAVASHSLRRLRASSVRTESREWHSRDGDEGARGIEHIHGDHSRENSRGVGDVT